MKHLRLAATALVALPLFAQPALSAQPDRTDEPDRTDSDRPAPPASGALATKYSCLVGFGPVAPLLSGLASLRSPKY